VRYLFATFDGGGNLPPELALAGRLRDRGHDVRFLGHASQRAMIERAGIAFSPWTRAPDHDTSTPETSPIDDWTVDQPSEMLALVRERLAFGPAKLFAEDLVEEVGRRPFDALAVDYFLFGALAAAESSRLPTVVLHHTCWGQARAWNDGLPDLNALRAELGLPPVRDVFEQYRRANRVLVLTSRVFDFAIEERELPANVIHVGPQIAPSNGSRPSPGAQPLVLVSFSTTYQAQEEVVRRIVRALGTLPVDALVTTGPAVRLDEPLPVNVESASWIPHGEVLPRAALVITHGGLGTVMAALAHGVPLICLPMGRDQHGNAARVGHLDAGRTLPSDASSEQIAETVAAALADPDLALNAGRLGVAIRDDIAADRAVQELEALLSASEDREPG